MKKATQQKLLYLSVLLLSSCSLIIPPLDNGIPPVRNIEPAQIGYLLTDLSKSIEPEKKPVVAVYPTSFTDQTGQRRSNSQYASFSTAITQSPDAYLIRPANNKGFTFCFSSKDSLVVRMICLSFVKLSKPLRSTTSNTFECFNALIR